MSAFSSRIVRDVASGRILGTTPAPRPVTLCSCGGHAFAPLTRWGVVLVSPGDAHLLSLKAWHLAGVEPFVYAWASSPKEALHRRIMAAPPDLMVDHKNGDGLDCRRPNLRIATRSQNSRNRKAPVAASGFYGVTIHRKSGLWRGYVWFDGRQKSAGYYERPEEAARARDNLAAMLLDEFAVFNFERNAI